MTNYELTYIVSNQYTEEELDKIKQKIDKTIENHQGIIGHQDSLGKKKLAYPINKVANGYYMIVEFELEDSSEIKKIDNELKLDNEIIRSMIITKPKITQEEIDKIKQKRNSKKDQPKTETPKPRKTEPKVKEKEESKEEEEKKEKTDDKVGIEKLDEKIDEILEDDNIIV